jgi:dTDP-4-amino-4,6-dideoxygalactose transaminase
MSRNVPPLAVPLIDMEAMHRPLRARVLERLAAVYDSGRFVLGPEVQSFEREAAQYLGARHCVGVSNGTDALVCALSALQIGQGDTILTTPLSFIATATACLRSGAKLRFADVDPVSFNLSPAALSESEVQGINALVAVHLFGQVADIAALRARVPGRPVIEDAAQAFGARLGQAAVGTLGDVAAFSFFPGKPLGALGDAGLVATADPVLAERVRAARTHGRGQDGQIERVGGNYRLDEVQAAILRIKLEFDAERLARRAANARYYTDALAAVAEVVTPREAPGTSASWSVFSLRVLQQRDALRAHLTACGVETALYYPRPLHLEPALASLGYARGDFPAAEACAEQLLALPVHAELRAEQREHVASSIARFFGH